ncbi:MAG: DedA family protein [Sporichthyaceae bacterium]
MTAQPAQEPTPEVAEESDKPPSGADYGLPWVGPGHRADKILLFLIAFSGLFRLATMPLVPVLIADHTVLLALFRGSATAVVTMGAQVRTGEEHLAVALFAGLIGLMIFDPVFWWAGRRWGQNAITMLLGRSRNPEKQLRRLHRLTEKYGWLAVLTGYIGPIPVPLIAVAVGFGGMKLRTYLILDAIAAMLWLSLLVALGYSIGQDAIDVVEAIAKYALWISIGLVVVIVGRQIWSATRTAPARK